MKGNYLIKRAVIGGIIFSFTFFIIQEVKANENAKIATTLIENANKYKSLSQSYAHIAQKNIQDKVKNLSTLKKNEKIIKEALKKEVELLPQDYIVFYTSIPHLRLYQDVARKLYKRTVGRVGAFQKKAFQFVRYTPNDPIYKEYSSVSQFLIKEFQKEGIVDDNIAQLKTILVSTNIAFFGGMTFWGESTYEYFNNPQGWARPNSEWLKASLRSFGYPERFADALINLSQDIKTGQGDLFQIFIPRVMVDSIAYVSWRQGIPFDVYFLKNLLHIDKIGPISAAEFGAFGQKVFKDIAEFKRLYKAKDRHTLELVQYMIGRIMEGAFYMSRLIDHYKKDNSPYMDLYQARLLVGPSLLDPSSGLLIYRYTTLNAPKEQEYRIKLREIFKLMDQIKGNN